MRGPAGIETSSRSFEPGSQGWRRFAWSGGSVDSAFRPQTRSVEGTISLHHPTILTVIEGGCRSIEVASDCGHRYDGPDFAGSVSFVPPGCGRRLRMSDVRSQWVSLSLRPDLLDLGDERGGSWSRPEVPTFTNRRDGLLHTLLAELHRALGNGEPPDPIYCEALAVSAAQYLARRFGQADRCRTPAGRAALPGWRLRRVAEYVAAHLGDDGLRLDDLAASVGLSTGFFQRAFKQATGETPLAYIQRQRIERAMPLLSSPDLTVVEVAAKVGFQSPSHFARLFHRCTGLTPSQYRRGRG